MALIRRVLFQSLASSEINNIDAKIHKLSQLRTEFLEKLTKLEGQETNLEHEGTFTLYTPFLIKVNNIDNRLAEMQELQEIERIEEEAGIKQASPRVETQERMSGSFMSESIYGKLNSPQARRRRAMRIPSSKFTTYLRTDSDPCFAKTSRPWNQYSSTHLRSLPC